MLYNKIVNGTPMQITPEMIAQVINVIEKVHADSPLPVKYQ
jgi:hypothetical protein